MKRLTVNRVAGAGLRAHKRQYLSLAVGVFLSIFLVCSLCVAVQGLFLASREKIARLVGYEDAVCFDEERFDDAAFRRTGLFDRIGHVYVTAAVRDAEHYVGFYDGEASALLSRRCVEGRLPKAAGEIAVERGALEQLRVEAALGDRITLDLMPIDGAAAEARVFTLVGILTEQSALLDPARFTSAPGKVLKFPSLLVFKDEAGMESGRVAVHRVMTFTPYTAFSAVDKYRDEHEFAMVYGVSDGGELIFSAEQYGGDTAERDQLLVMAALLGGSLIMAACVGVSGAMEGQIARKREEIGMLRAVGATRRQIRRIFGREAWLLALTAAPFAVACACLFTWGLSVVAPDFIVFSPSPWLLAPAAALSAAVVLLASSLPLRRAGRTRPMGVLRDTAMLRRQRRVKSKKAFKVPRLIALRQTRLYPTRLIGSALLVALMMFFLSGFAQLLMTNFEDAFKERADFEMYIEYSVGYGSAYADVYPRSTLSERDIAQIEALPTVARAVIERQIYVNADVGAATEYVKPQKDGFDMANIGLLTEEEIAERFDSSNPLQRVNLSYRARYEGVRDAMGMKGDMVRMPLMVVPIDENALAPYVAQGKIDLEAIDAGREVLVFAPDQWRYAYRGDQGTVYYSTMYEMPKSGAFETYLPNDQFFAGQTLPLTQAYLFSDEADASRYFYGNLTYEEARAEYAAVRRRDASPVIGAVIAGKAPFEWIFYSAPAVVTSEKGLRAMGLYPGSMDKISVYLSGRPDADTEQYLQSRLENIVLRAPGATLFNKLEATRRRDREGARSLIVLGCVVLLFFAVSVSLVVGNASRRVQADKRAIGTLRAVGANERDILRCYAGQAFVGILLGAFVGVAFSLFFLLRASYSRAYWDEALILQTLFLALILLCSAALLRARVKSVMHRSIIDNIREL